MREIVVFPHALGLTDDVTAIASTLRDAGHTSTLQTCSTVEHSRRSETASRTPRHSASRVFTERLLAFLERLS